MVDKPPQGIPVSIVNGKQIQADISGPQGANRLFIFTGIALVNFTGNIPGGVTRSFFEVHLGDPSVFKTHQVLQLSATASLNSIDGPGGWAVDDATAIHRPDIGKISLFVDIAADVDARITRVAYEVYVIARKP